MGVNSDPKGEGTNQQTPIGQSQKSSNAWLGLSDYVAGGTNGSRPNMGADKYGGDANDGQLFKGNSVASDNRELNSGGNEKASNNTGQYGDDKKIEKGTVAARENMPKYGTGAGGAQNWTDLMGNLVGAGAGATKNTDPNDQYKRDLPTQPGQDLVAGTDESKNRNMPKAQRGIGKPGAKGARM